MHDRTSNQHRQPQPAALFDIEGAYETPQLTTVDHVIRELQRVALQHDADMFVQPIGDATSMEAGIAVSIAGVHPLGVCTVIGVDYSTRVIGAEADERGHLHEKQAIVRHVTARHGHIAPSCDPLDVAHFEGISAGSVTQARMYGAGIDIADVTPVGEAVRFGAKDLAGRQTAELLAQLAFIPPAE